MKRKSNKQVYDFSISTPNYILFQEIKENDHKLRINQKNKNKNEIKMISPKNLLVKNTWLLVSWNPISKAKLASQALSLLFFSFTLSILIEFPLKNARKSL